MTVSTRLPCLPSGRSQVSSEKMGARLTGISSDVFGRRNQVEIRGVNPGFAMGQLEVVLGRPETASFSGGKIYALSEAPADMKPVAGIATVSEGNLVSHVQLLARNLGIPNAVLSGQLLRSLEPYRGQEVFYAVSPRGAVRMKPATDMTAREKGLVEGRKRKEERIAVPTDRVDLNESGLLSMSTMRASDSGRFCGPKAANLGQLKALFPDRVVDGLVIPFGVFRQHLDQQMPGTPSTYWHHLQETFLQASRNREAGLPEEEIEAATLERLSHLREEIRKMEFLPEFTARLSYGFRAEFGAEIGGLAVFIRSDTNMEDLKDFTGAGLNLTVFNVLEEDKILQAIREVWASPFTERSYRWRQRYLLNPENVYPSILILPSVNVDKSGVMITSGVVTSNPEDTTVAFSRGVGGAVEGQAAESYLLRPDGSQASPLAVPGDPVHGSCPLTGGVEKRSTRLDRPILSHARPGTTSQHGERDPAETSGHSRDRDGRALRRRVGVPGRQNLALPGQALRGEQAGAILGLSQEPGSEAASRSGGSLGRRNRGCRKPRFKPRERQRGEAMKGRMPGLILWVFLSSVYSDIASGYPIDGYPGTGIRRLARLSLIAEGKLSGNLPPPGARRPLSEIRLNLLGPEGDALAVLPAPDPGLQKQIDSLFPDRHESYAVALMDITPGKPVRVALRQADRQLSPGSVGKLAIAAGLFKELESLYPDSVEKRQELLRERKVVAGRWIRTDHHNVPIFDPEARTFVSRPIREGDVFSLYEWADHMVSASANAAASTVWKELMLMRQFGAAYPPAPEQEEAFFRDTPRAELRDMAMSVVNDPLREIGISQNDWQLGSLFTSTGKRLVPPGGGAMEPLGGCSPFSWPSSGASWSMSGRAWRSSG